MSFYKLEAITPTSVLIGLDGKSHFNMGSNLKVHFVEQSAVSNVGNVIRQNNIDWPADDNLSDVLQYIKSKLPEYDLDDIDKIFKLYHLKL